MNAKLKPRKQTLSKPSRTGRRAAKASSTVGKPDELKILNLTYKVIFSSQEEMIGSGTMGFCSVDAQLIVVAEDQANDAMQDTFLHEVMHALTAAFDLKEKDKEESFVRRLATGICTVWKDNPKAFKWWRELILVAGGFQYLGSLGLLYFGLVDHRRSFQSQRIVSGNMAPPCFKEWPPWPKTNFTS